MAFIVELREPLKGVSQTTGEQILCIGLYESAGELQWLVVEGSDGKPSVEAYNAVRVDWRFDNKLRAWIDVGTPREDAS